MAGSYRYDRIFETPNTRRRVERKILRWPKHDNSKSSQVLAICCKMLNENLKNVFMRIYAYKQLKNLKFQYFDPCNQGVNNEEIIVERNRYHFWNQRDISQNQWKTLVFLVFVWFHWFPDLKITIERNLRLLTLRL